MPTRRLLVRTVWLALPVTITLLILAVFNHLTIRAALLAWVLGLVLSSVLAWRRERRLQETRGYLAALVEGREPPPLPEFGPLGGDELATVLHRLDRALSEERERRAETDRWLRALLDALPDPLLVVDDGRVVASANPPRRGCSVTIRSASCSRPACAIPASSPRSTRRCRGTARPSSTCTCRDRRRARLGSRSCRSGCARAPPR